MRYHLCWNATLSLITVTLDSVSYNAYELVYTMIHRVSSRVFVGKQFCHDESWVAAVAALPLDVEAVKAALLPFPAFLRSLVALVLPARRRLTRNHANVRNLLFPSSNLAQSREELTVLKFLIQTSKDSDPDSLASRLLLLTAAAVRFECVSINKLTCS